MISLRNSVLSLGIGAAALVIIGAPAQSSVFDDPAPSSASALAGAQNELVTDIVPELAEPTARVLVAQGPPESPPPGPPDWADGKAPSVPPVSPRKPLG